MAANGSPLSGILDEWLREEAERHPVAAANLGLDGYESLLGDFSAGAFEARQAADRRWLERFEAAPDDGGDGQESLDRALVVSALRGRAVLHDREQWRRDPAEYVDPCTNGVLTLFIRRLLPEPALADAAAARLDQVPEVTDRAIAQLDPALVTPLQAGRVARQCRSGAGYFRADVPAEVSDDKARAKVADAGRRAADALERLAGHLEGIRAAGEPALGEARYSALLAQRELLDVDAGQLRERGARAWMELDEQMTEVAAELGHSSWHEALSEVNSRRPATPEEMLEGYRRATERCRRFLLDHELVTLPEGEECRVVPSPVFQRPLLAVASYMMPAPFKPSRTGHFFVPYPPDGVTPADIGQRLATNSYATMPTIAAHEAYPGHHWHLSWVRSNPRPVRHWARTSYFVEGWALYAERVMAEAGFFAGPAEMLCHLDARIFRAARIVVDTSLHCGDMTVDEAVAHMVGHTGLTDATARAEVGRYCAWPTQAASYLTGAMEMERMRDRYLEAGRGDLRDFNDAVAVAATGSMPPALAARAVFG